MNSPDPKPFRILGVQQVAIGGTDRQALSGLWEGCFGLTSVGHFRSETENVDEKILQVGRGLGLVEVDLMQPVDPTQRPRVDSPALHHIGLWVDDLRAAAHWLIGKGVRLTRGGIRGGASGHDVCFIHPRGNSYFPLSGEGVLIELVQAPSDLVSSYDNSPPP